MDPDFYTQWFTLNWAKLHIRDLGSLSGGSIRFTNLKTESGEFGLGSYVNWGISLLIAIAGAVIWTFLDRKRANYTVLYYFITTLVAYSLCVKLQGLTFSKVFPSQMPDLAVTQLNTPYGDFTMQKHYWIQFSFVHGYEIFAGLAELLIMLLLFFRQTRAWGAALSIAMVGNIAIANHVYDGGVHVLAMLYPLGGTDAAQAIARRHPNMPLIHHAHNADPSLFGVYDGAGVVACPDTDEHTRHGKVAAMLNTCSITSIARERLGDFAMSYAPFRSDSNDDGDEDELCDEALCKALAVMHSAQPFTNGQSFGKQLDYSRFDRGVI